MTDEVQKLKMLKHKRGTLKSQLTLFQKFIDNVETSNINEKDKQNIKLRKEKVEPLYELFEQLQGEIELIALELGQEMSQEVAERESFSNVYFEILGIANNILNPTVKDTESSVDTNLITYPNSNQTHDSHMHVKLPTITLPTFDGTFTLWREFYDAFTALIHSNHSLSDVQKLSYLKSSLKNEPADLIRSYDTTSQNYTIAWNALQKRYNNKRRIITDHIQNLLDIAKITKESHSSLRQLINQTENHIQCLKALGQPTDEWNALIVPIIASKLDFTTNKEWELKLSSDADSCEKMPTLSEFLKFLNNRQNTLETISRRKVEVERKQSNSKPLKTFTTLNNTCSFCEKEHSIHICQEFLKLNDIHRNEKARELKLCINCLRKGHFIQNCLSKSTCKKCHKKHHTLLHKETVKEETKRENVDTPIVTCSSVNTATNVQTLLSTALVHVQNNQGTYKELRALLDSASQSNFITESMCRFLNLEKQPIDMNVTGISNGVTSIKYKVQITIKSAYNNFKTQITCLVLPSITNSIPARSFSKNLIRLPSNITLADPLFNESRKIDLLLGASIFWQLLCVGQIREKNCPTLQKTRLGWIIAGDLRTEKVPEQNTQSLLTLNDLNDSVERFWQADELTSKKRNLTREENHVETYFKETTTRNKDGKFVVRIPLKNNVNDLGDSKQIAEQRFFKLEAAFRANPELKKLYTDFMKEYRNLGHMTVCEAHTAKAFYLPHHPVLKEASETTKLRVVFDGSCKLDNGVPINLVQYTGPTIQDDLFSIIARFRTYAVAITADIEKMYRQIWVHPEDRTYQLIVWREEPEDELKTFKLNTVTYGTTAAPYLAIRSLYQLGLDQENTHPRESEVIKHDFYVDDLLTGANTTEEALQLKYNIDDILKTAGFHLRKWNSNVQDLRETNDNTTSIDGKLRKTLGIGWNPTTDEFCYSIKEYENDTRVTKRTILATTAQLFDPLGLLAPTTIIGKFILKELWQHDYDWDESISLDIQTKWLKYRDKLKHINFIKIPRHVIVNDPITIELHAFSDASEKGYGACIYLKTLDRNHHVRVRLLAAKTRVAPMKSVTLPRLELCAAVVSAELANKFKGILQLPISKEYYWCDSQITLHWIKSPPHRWKTYVANRVSTVQELTKPENWYYVESADNSADIITRGILPDQLPSLKQWWNGPTWLSYEDIQFATEPQPKGNENLLEVQEQKVTQTLLITNDFNLLEKYSSLTKLKRIIALCLRFKRNCLSSPSQRTFGPLTAQELNNAMVQLLKLSQKECFHREIAHLNQGKQINSKSSILSLTPFLDSEGLLRVGGRLKLSKFSYNKKHPILLPKAHHLTNLILTHEHEKLLHCGPKLLLTTIRENYWPINGKNSTKQIVNKCIKCCRYKAKSPNPIMGNLPEERLALNTYPFYTVGVDYAGPFLIKNHKGRGAKVSKAYICLFICLSTKAIHLELVTELSTSAFLATLRRFIARRGKPACIFSDNATNFVGARNELNSLGEFLIKNNQTIANSISNETINWKFIPPHSPNFGGLWEAGVKSTKHHLKRVLAQTPLTFEEFSTLLTQIEAILNSRPLTPITDNPNEYDVLTPAHFLIGRSFSLLPDPDYSKIPIPKLNRFQHLQLMTRHFWDKWYKEYVSELKVKSKWKQDGSSLKVGQMVLIKEDNIPPAHWKLGRITRTHPGDDGIVRVVTIKCMNGEVKRPVRKLGLLPIENPDDFN